MNIHQFTGIGRLLDPNHPTNLAILVVSLLVGIVGGLVQLISGSGLAMSAVWGFEAGLGAFFSWALSREIDPKHEVSAFISTGLFIISLVFVNSSAILSLLWVLIGLRILNRITGVPAKITDGLIFLALGTWVSYHNSAIYIFITTVIFLLDALLNPPNRKQLVLTGLSIVISVVLWVGSWTKMGIFDLSPINMGVLLGIGLLFILTNIPSNEVNAQTDVTGEPLDLTRVRIAQGISLIFSILLALFEGFEGIVALLPLWSTFLGVSLYRLFIMVNIAPSKHLP